MKKNSPLVSIITPNFNGEKYLEETIKSVINQTYKKIEYIFDKTFGIATPIIGPAEDSVKKNPRRK